MTRLGWKSGALLLLAAGCASRTVPLASNETAPAARGELQLKPRDSGNMELRIEVSHLAPAERVQRGAAQYVVWVDPVAGSGPPQNVGALALGDDLEASLKTLTPLEKFDLFITPEPSGRTEGPTGPRVLQAAVR